MLIFALVACSSATDDSAGSSADSGDTAADTADTAGDTGADTGDSATDDTFDLGDPTCPESTGYVAQPPHAAVVLSGTGAWSLAFDEDAEAVGFSDCDYARTYGELVEMEGHAWQCPGCELLTGGAAEVVSGYANCFAQISSAEAIRVEHLGLGEVDGELHLFRTGSENTPLADMGPLTGSGTEADPYVGGWTDEATLTEGGTMVLTGTVELVRGESETVWVEDVAAPREEPYACGWPQCSPGGPSPTLTLSTGGVLPDERFTDTCGDEVALWDFWGRYLVIDASSPDCGPCIAMADAEQAWVDEMAARGITVEWITLLNATLSHINQSPDAATLAQWDAAFDGEGPVLADEGYGYALFPAYVGGDGGMSFPTVVVVNPDMQVLGWDSGYSSAESGGTGFSAIEALIVADAAAR